MVEIKCFHFINSSDEIHLRVNFTNNTEEKNTAKTFLWNYSSVDNRGIKQSTVFSDAD